MLSSRIASYKGRIMRTQGNSGNVDTRLCSSEETALMVKSGSGDGWGWFLSRVHVRLCATSVNSCIKRRCKKEREAVKQKQKKKSRRQSKVDENSHHRHRGPRGELTVVLKCWRLRPPGCFGVLWQLRERHASKSNLCFGNVSGSHVHTAECE